MGRMSHLLRFACVTLWTAARGPRGMRAEALRNGRGSELVNGDRLGALNGLSLRCAGGDEPV
jgi:hypothetical protein